MSEISKTSIGTLASRIALVSSVAAAMGVASVATAQQQGPPSRSWFKVCTKQAETDICNVQFNVAADTGQLITAVNLLTVKGKINRRIFQVAVPTGRFLPEGLSVRIDEGKVNKLPYTICLPNRCLAEVQLSDQLVSALKRGNKITLTSVNFQNKKNPIEVTLTGFTAAYDGPAIQRTDLEKRQKKLQEELQKKAEAARKKLEDAQNAAKESN